MAQRIARRTGHDLATDRVHDDLERALATISDPADVGLDPSSRQPIGDRARDFTSRERSLELVRRNENRSFLLSHREPA